MLPKCQFWTPWRNVLDWVSCNVLGKVMHVLGLCLYAGCVQHMSEVVMSNGRTVSCPAFRFLDYPVHADKFIPCLFNSGPPHCVISDLKYQPCMVIISVGLYRVYTCRIGYIYIQACRSTHCQGSKVQMGG